MTQTDDSAYLARFGLSTIRNADSHGRPEHIGTPGTCEHCHADAFCIPEDES